MPHPDDLSDEERDLAGYNPQTQEEIDLEEARKVRVQQLRELVLFLMGNDLFREWLMAKINSMGGFENPFGVSPAGFPDRDALMFAQGRKSAGWQLWEEVDDIAPDLASLMRREQAGRDKLAERQPRR